MAKQWTNELVLQLLDEYENFPILWNPKHADHFSREKKLDAWEIISNKMKIDVNQIKQKMNSLLGSFRREKAKGKKSIGTGKGRTEIYFSKWFAFERMNYLLDKDEPRATIDTENFEDDLNIQEQDDTDTLERNSHNEQDQTINCNESTDVENIKFPTTEPIAPKKKRIRIRSDNVEDPRLDEAFNILKQSVASKESLDESAVYSQYIANKMRHYSKTTRMQVEHDINNILYNADMGKYENPYPTLFPQYIQNVASGFPYSTVASPSASFVTNTTPSSCPTPTSYSVIPKDLLDL